MKIFALPQWAAVPLQNPNIRGIAFLVTGMAIFSLQNVAIRAISDFYAVLEIVIVRSLIALPCILLFFRMEGGRGLPSTHRLGLEVVRGLLLFISYTTYFMGLAALSLADAAAIRFSAPMFLTLFSVTLLGETVGPRRWGALLVGFAGVLLIIQPGAANFNIGSIFVLVTTITYALSAICTRLLRGSESSASMAFFSTLTYLAGAFLFGPLFAAIGDAGVTHPSMLFLLRSWALPTAPHFAIMMALGVVWASGMYCVARAYSLALASVAAPFEYVTLPINMGWGYLIWHEIPTAVTWVGAFLTVGSGLYITYRERVKRE